MRGSWQKKCTIAREGMMTINAIFGRELMLDRSPITFTSKMERLEGYGTALAEIQPFKRRRRADFTLSFRS